MPDRPHRLQDCDDEPRRSNMEGATLGTYEIRSVVRRSMAGTLCTGWDPAHAREVAIRTLPLPAADDDGQRKRIRFQHMARAAASLRHPSIVSVHDTGRQTAWATWLWRPSSASR